MFPPTESLSPLAPSGRQTLPILPVVPQLPARDGPTIVTYRQARRLIGCRYVARHGALMAKKHRRVPRYEQDAERAKREAERLTGEQARAEKAKSRIQADLSRQAPNNSYGGGPLYYEDLEFTCRDCGRQETWTAQQQQWWYEVAQGPIYSTAVRCRACREVRRGENPEGV